MFTQARDFLISCLLFVYIVSPESVGKWLAKVAMGFSEYTVHATLGG